jgi:hypothetical protein
MTERLIIKNFAGIQHIDIEIKKFNILIGPQASGKSICAKLLYYFKNFIPEVLDSLNEVDYSKKQIDAKQKLRFEQYFPSISWGKQPFLIRYENPDSFIEITSLKTKDRGIKLDYSDNYKKLVNTLKKMRISGDPEKVLTPTFEQDVIKAWRSNILRSVESLIGKSALKSQIFIPAGRSIFAIVQRSIFSFLAQKDELDPFLISFGSLYQFIKRAHSHSPPNESNSYMKNLAKEIVCGEYRELRSEDFIEMTDGRIVNLSCSSSGQQETLPLTMILMALPRLRRGFNDCKTVYLEEPEAHIFPNAQRKLVELIAASFNLNPGKTQFFITTHSPYVLTAINNLLQAGESYNSNLKGDALKKLKKLVPQSIALNAEDLAVYSITSEGVENILSTEFGLIDTNIIDEVSNDLSVEFGELLDLVN